MDDHLAAAPAPTRSGSPPTTASFDAFRRLVDRGTDPADWPHAARVEQNVLVYDGPAVARAAADPAARRALAAEWAAAFATGPGVLVIAGAYPDPAPIDRATELFTRIIEEQHRTRTGRRRPFRQARRQRPHLERAREALPRRPAKASPSTTATKPSRSPPRPGSARTTR